MNDNDPVAEWDRRLDEKVQRGMKRTRAISTLVREDPELHRAYLVAYNLEHGRDAAVSRQFGSPR